MLQFATPEIFNIVHAGNYFTNPKFASLVSVNTSLSALISVILSKWTGFGSTIQTYLTTGAGAGLVPDLIIANSTVATILTPFSYTFVPDATFNNAAKAIAYAFIQTDYISGTTNSLPSIGGLTAISDGPPTIGAATFPTYVAPSANTILSLLAALTAMLPKMGTPITNYTSAAPAGSLPYAVIGCILGSIDSLITNLNTAITKLTTKFGGVSYDPTADGNFLTAVGNLQSAANAITTRLQLEITTYNTYIAQLKDYALTDQLLLLYQNPAIAPIMQIIANDPNINPNLIAALQTATNNATT